MYKIIGTDGKEYGPISLEQLQQWRAEGRINAQTGVLGPGAAEWKTAGDFPELGFGAPPAILGPEIGRPGAVPLAQSGPKEKGLATASLVLGILSLTCFGLLAGIPAVICGHIARSRVRGAPARYSGSGLALAGLIMGYFSVFVTLIIMPAMLLPALARAKDRAQQINCRNNMKMAGLALRTWALDHNNEFPFNVSASQGGTMEYCRRDATGLDQNSYLHFRVMSNELSTPKILVCVADPSKQAATDFANLTAANVSYQVFSAANIKQPQQVLAVCPIHGNELLVDGSVRINTKHRR